jgi:hypothetical protein
MKNQRLTFKSMQDRDLYIHIGSHYRMLKPGVEFTIESEWQKCFDDWIVQGLIALTHAEVIPDPKSKRYRSIDDD